MSLRRKESCKAVPEYQDAPSPDILSKTVQVVAPTLYQLFRAIRSLADSMSERDTQP
jgi:hypothetical protein